MKVLTSVISQSFFVFFSCVCLSIEEVQACRGHSLSLQLERSCLKAKGKGWMALWLYLGGPQQARPHSRGNYLITLYLNSSFPLISALISVLPILNLAHLLIFWSHLHYIFLLNPV